MFPGFEEFTVATATTTIHGRRGGEGPPLFLLHGMPETHLMWHRVAPLLAPEFTVVATDLRGFGDSGMPPSAPDHAPYSMREIARDQVDVMRELGFERFAVAGHDRGGRCAYRLAFDHPQRCRRSRCSTSSRRAKPSPARQGVRLGFWIWSFLAAPFPVPEKFIARAPSVIVDHMLDDLSASADVFPPEVRAEYVGKLSDPAAIHAICEEYRAAATLDVAPRRGRPRASAGSPAPCSRSGAGTARSGAGTTRSRSGGRWADDVNGEPMTRGTSCPRRRPRRALACSRRSCAEILRA